jgi:hypothetical protein
MFSIYFFVLFSYSNIKLNQVHLSDWAYNLIILFSYKRPASILVDGRAVDRVVVELDIFLLCILSNLL